MTEHKLAEFYRKIVMGPNCCWQWVGCREQNGYPRLYHSKDKEQYAHRAAYIHFIGPIPNDLEIDHLCNNRSCVNPAHLEAVTRAENCRRTSVRMSACHNGHPFVDGSYRMEETRRRCLQCKRDYDANYRQLRRQKE